MEETAANLYLVGFMGTGKSTVGRHAAQRLGFAFLDSDREIEQLQGRAISEIFATRGEAAFREMEREFVEHGHPATRQVVACGGGMVTQPGILELLQGKGVVICLYAPVETILERTSRHQHRPLLNVENREERIRELFGQREAVYRRSGTLVSTAARPLREIVDHVLRIYQREARELAKTQGGAEPGRRETSGG